MWKHLSYRQFKDFFGDLGLTAWVKFNWLAEVPDGFDKVLADSLNWSYNSAREYFDVAISDIQPVLDTGVSRVMLSKYETILPKYTGGMGFVEDKTICQCQDSSGTSKLVLIKDLDCATSAELKTALKGVWLIYKKAE